MSKTRKERCSHCGFMDVIKWERQFISYLTNLFEITEPGDGHQHLVNIVP